jgi:hypothetical protein
LRPRKEKKSLNRVHIFFFRWVDTGIIKRKIALVTKCTQKKDLSEKQFSGKIAGP